jgi:hypothetical protein
LFLKSRAGNFLKAGGLSGAVGKLTAPVIVDTAGFRPSLARPALSDFITSRMPTRQKRGRGQNQTRLRAHSYDMKFVLRNLLIAALPLLLRELFKRLDAGRQPSRHRRHLLARRY